MPRRPDDFFKKIESQLFKDTEEAASVLSENELEIKKRWMLSVSKLLETPTTTDTEMIQFLKGGCGGSTKEISQSHAYRDFASIQRIVGNISSAGKEWYRYMVIDMCKKAYAVAQMMNDGKGMALAADKIGKYTRLDQLDEEPFDFDQMIPPDIEPTDDVTVLGIEAIDNLEEQRMEYRAIFKNEAIDTHYDKR